MNAVWKRRGLALCLALTLAGLAAMGWVGADGSGWRGFGAAASAGVGTFGMALLLMIRTDTEPKRMDHE